MRQKKRWLSLVTAAALAVGILFSPVPAQASELDIAAAREDFYEAANEEALAGMTIPADSASVGRFDEVQNQIDSQMEGLITGYAQNLSGLAEDSDEYKLGALYLCAVDTAIRDAYGLGSTMENYIARIEAAADVEELLNISLEMSRKYNMGTLVSAIYTADLKNVEENMLTAGTISLPLSKAYWLGTDETSSMVRALYLQLLSDLYQIHGMNETEADSLAAQFGNLFTALAPAQLNPEDYYNPEKLYNVYKVSDLADFFNGKLPVETLCRLFEAEPEDEVMIQEPAWMMAVGSMMTEENLPLLKAIMVGSIYTSLASVTDTQSLEAVLTFEQLVNGAQEPVSFEKNAMDNTVAVLTDFASRVYVENCFDETVKADVEEMTRQILAVFRERILNLTWMQEETKQEAVKKIDTMTVNAAYPDEWPEYMDSVQIVPPSEGGSFVDNYLNIRSISMENNIARKDEPIEPDDWSGVSTYAVNAFYQPSYNAIFLPASILQGEFYDSSASEAKNLGGIGSVIGHEITHAFDNSGALYDEKGNFRNWWTDEDYEMFNQLSQKVVDYYNGYEVDGIQVNGTQTLGENIADLGGVSAVTQLAQSKGLDLAEVYEQWASIWAEKATPENLYMQAMIDVHAPNKVRVNAVLSAMPEFYEVYGIMPGDGMYQAPENRPAIW